MNWMMLSSSVTLATMSLSTFFFFQAEDGIRDHCVTGVQTCALPIWLLQRAGRSGHRPGATSRVTCVPTNALELVEIAAARDGVECGALESRLQMERPLDVLAQHVVTVALGGGFDPDQLLAEVRMTRAYAALSDAEWAWVIEFLTYGGDALRAYPEYARITLVDGRYVVTHDEIARRHRMSIGTIVGDAQIGVQYLRGGALGSVEESFVARLKPGDRFVFAGTPLEFVRVRDMKAWVRRAPNGKGAIPRWMGSRRRCPASWPRWCASGW